MRTGTEGAGGGLGLQRPKRMFLQKIRADVPIMFLSKGTASGTDPASLRRRVVALKK
jgi:hypothetical protein